MFERYTERARRILFFARYEASQCGSRSIAPEHLLLGLIRDGKGIDSRIFSHAGVNRDTLRREIEARLVFEEKLSTSVDIPFTEAAKRVLQFATLEADRLLHNDVGPEHLLLGLLHERNTIAAELLNAHGLRLDDVREQIVILVSERFSPIGPNRLGHSVGSQRGGAPPSLFTSAFNLKSLLAQVLNVDGTRIEVPPDLEQRLFSLAHERRSIEVFVLTGVPGKVRRVDEPADAGGGVSDGSFMFSTATLSSEAIPSPLGASLHSLGPLRMHGATIADLARMFEGVLNHPVIDESNLDGRYDVAVSGPHSRIDAFITALEHEAGLTLMRTTREVEMVVVR